MAVKVSDCRNKNGSSRIPCLLKSLDAKSMLNYCISVNGDLAIKFPIIS